MCQERCPEKLNKLELSYLISSLVLAAYFGCETISNREKLRRQAEKDTYESNYREKFIDALLELERDLSTFQFVDKRKEVIDNQKNSLRELKHSYDKIKEVDSLFALRFQTLNNTQIMSL